MNTCQITITERNPGLFSLQIVLDGVKIHNARTAVLYGLEADAITSARHGVRSERAAQAKNKTANLKPQTP